VRVVVLQVVVVTHKLVLYRQPEVAQADLVVMVTPEVQVVELQAFTLHLEVQAPVVKVTTAVIAPTQTEKAAREAAVEEQLETVHHLVVLQAA
jgi:capsular polysaccharide biosynthesis protein